MTDTDSPRHDVTVKSHHLTYLTLAAVAFGFIFGLTYQ